MLETGRDCRGATSEGIDYIMGSAKAGLVSLVGLINGLIFLDNNTIGPEEGLVPKDEVGVDTSQGQVLDDHVVSPISFVINGKPEG
jgi:hypothetical protein